jgi:hypothetical protein
MKIIKLTMMLIIAYVLYTATLNGAVGCMDNSQHLKQMYDTKAYHYVSCDCPCRSKGPGTNRCARCGHLIVPQEEEYVTSADALHTKNINFNQFMKDPAKKLQHMIQEYRRK